MNPSSRMPRALDLAITVGLILACLATVLAMPLFLLFRLWSPFE